MGRNREFDPSLKRPSIKSLLAHRKLERILKIGELFRASSSHLSIFEIILGPKIGYAHGNYHPKC